MDTKDDIIKNKKDADEMHRAADEILMIIGDVEAISSLGHEGVSKESPLDVSLICLKSRLQEVAANKNPLKIEKSLIRMVGRAEETCQKTASAALSRFDSHGTFGKKAKDFAKFVEKYRAALTEIHTKLADSSLISKDDEPKTYTVNDQLKIAKMKSVGENILKNIKFIPSETAKNIAADCGIIKYLEGLKTTAKPELLGVDIIESLHKTAMSFASEQIELFFSFGGHLGKERADKSLERLKEINNVRPLFDNMLPYIINSPLFKRDGAKIDKQQAASR